MMIGVFDETAATALEEQINQCVVKENKNDKNLFTFGGSLLIQS